MPVPQSGLYQYLLKSIDGFRLYIGAPDTERFNLVLFGGMYIRTYVLSATVF